MKEMKSRKMRWEFHAVHVGEEILVGKPEWKRPLTEDSGIGLDGRIILKRY
jgi:hypothetical protein